MEGLRVWFLLAVAAVTTCGGQDYECNLRPRSSTYHCAVDSEQDPIFPPECYPDASSLGLAFGYNCTPIVGMTLEIVCTNQSLVLYRDNVSLGSSAVTYFYITPSFSGLYECRYNGSNETDAAPSRNVVVDILGTPVIGLQCEEQEFITLPSGSFGCGMNYFTPPPYAFNVYCVNCSITVDVQWANHVGVDLDLRVTRDSNQSIAYTIASGSNAKIPYIVNYVGYGYEPMVAILVTATTNYVPEAVASVCFTQIFYYSSGLYAQLIPPVEPKISIGEEAVFQCEYSSNDDLAAAVVNLLLANGTSYTAICNSSSCSGDSELVLSNTLRIDAAARIHVATLTLSILSVVFNNSQVTCSLWYSDAIQWSNATNLIISPNYDAHVIPVSNTPSPLNAQYPLALVGGLVSGILVILIGTIILVIVLVCLKRNKPHMEQVKIVILQTLSTMPKRNGIASTEWHSSSTSIDALNMSNSNAILLNSGMTPSTSTTTSLLDLNRKVKSMSDIETSRKVKEDNVRVYISYSNEKSSWVSGYLKPLIQNLILGSEVTVHNDDMIAGHPISEERMRLILKADKVLIVCSPGYEHSPWCQYELLHSISKDPGLMDGRIISILCDSCNTVPPIISGVVSIRDDDSMFESKLQQCFDKNACV